MNGIREVRAAKDKNGKYRKVRIVFGPHYFLELHDDAGKVVFVLGATHHGFKADAYEINGELEKFIYEIRESHPGNTID